MTSQPPGSVKSHIPPTAAPLHADTNGGSFVEADSTQTGPPSSWGPAHSGEALLIARANDETQTYANTKWLRVEISCKWEAAGSN